VTTTPPHRSDVVGVVLAGGAGSRIGGAKATVLLGGRPLLAWPLTALTSVLGRVAVVTKADVELPDLGPTVQRWNEPDLPRHPITGIIEALQRARGASVFVCAVDLPLVDADLIRRLLRVDDDGALAVVAASAHPQTSERRLQPLLARYAPAALAPLAAAPSNARLTESVWSLDPVVVDVPVAQLLNVNDAGDLEAAERALRATRDA
jgi:molybdopterin-guanine dinucleotide biosynthesis protein A